ncbi:MAG: hypothetical protein ACR2J5_03485 [Geodermatophilaceae bacterium]
MIDEQFSRAVVAYVGRVGLSYWDNHVPEDSVAAACGSAAPELLARIKAMFKELYAEKPEDSPEAGGLAKAWLRAHHPELSDEAVDAVSNQFAFNWR